MAGYLRMTGNANGSPSKWEGAWLRGMDFEAYQGRGQVDLCEAIHQAMRFDDSAAAVEFIERQPEAMPFLENGQPNRPLTAMSWRYVDAG